MNRREEIVTATLGCRQNYVDLKRPITPDDVADAFEKGAYWADKTMIDKVCEWLMNFKNAAGEFPLYDYVGNFRKAMEEYE